MESKCTDNSVDFLFCGACHEILKEPRLLVCQHTVCEGCLNPDATSNVISCPECGSQSTINQVSVDYVGLSYIRWLEAGEKIEDNDLLVECFSRAIALMEFLQTKRSQLISVCSNESCYDEPAGGHYDERLQSLWAIIQRKIFSANTHTNGYRFPGGMEEILAGITRELNQVYEPDVSIVESNAAPLTKDLQINQECELNQVYEQDFNIVESKAVQVTEDLQINQEHGKVSKILSVESGFWCLQDGQAVLLDHNFVEVSCSKAHRNRLNETCPIVDIAVTADGEVVFAVEDSLMIEPTCEQLPNGWIICRGCCAVSATKDEIIAAETTNTGMVIHGYRKSAEAAEDERVVYTEVLRTIVGVESRIKKSCSVSCVSTGNMLLVAVQGSYYIYGFDMETDKWQKFNIWHSAEDKPRISSVDTPQLLTLKDGRSFVLLLLKGCMYLMDSTTLNQPWKQVNIRNVANSYVSQAPPIVNATTLKKRENRISLHVLDDMNRVYSGSVFVQ